MFPILFSATEIKKVETKKDRRANQRHLIYLLLFLFTLHFTPATYLESTFIENLLGKEQVGVIFSTASIFSIIGLFLVRKIIKHVGSYKAFLTALILEFFSLSILWLSLFVDPSPVWTIVFILAFIVGFVSRSIAFFNFDIFTEHLSDDKEAGNIRGIFLTSLNFAFVIGPLLASMLVKEVDEVGKVFGLGILLLLPVIHITIKYFRNYQDAKYENYEFLATILHILHKPDLRRIFICNFLLFFFYSWMILYMPIFLLENIGFDLSQVSSVIAIGLIPFIMLQFLLGKIADEKMGEKELLTVGFIIMGTSTALITFISYKSFILWTGILFVTRIGASMVESMIETYLFKKVSDMNLDIISVYRTIRPFAYIIAPIIASFTLIFIDIKFLFLILGILMVLGINFSLRIKDTL